MRGLTLKIILGCIWWSAPVYAKDLFYLFIDAETPLEHRAIVSDFAGELLSRTDLGYNFDVYMHVDGIRIHYPDMPIYHASKRRDVSRFLAAVSELAHDEDYFSILKNEAPEFVETTDPATALGVVSKNIVKIEKSEGPYERKFFVQLSNIDFSEPADTSAYIFGDGWITAKNGPLHEFVFGSQSRVFKDTKVFVALYQPKDVPLSWFYGRREFLQKLYSSIGADIRSIRRVGSMPYGGGAILAESFVNAIASDFQSIGRAMPKDTNLVQIIDPMTSKVEIVP